MIKPFMIFLFVALTRPVLADEIKEPFSFADFTWLNGNSRQTTFPLATKYFTGQFTFDGNYIYDTHMPKDHTLSGSSNSGRTGEFQVQQLGVGGDFNYENVRGRFMTQFGMYSSMTPRTDASTSRGQFQMGSAYRYISEAYAGYHFNVLNGINLDAGLFLSYIGLCSYYNYENWIYQMSYVSSNTPWFFNGLRLQIFPSEKFKLELWLVNGWQSYGMYNEAPGVGVQVLYRPTGDWSFVSNEYYGEDWLGLPGRSRMHSDNGAQYKYYDKPKNPVSKAAASVTFDAGCETGGGVHCGNQNFIGFMIYNRLWFEHDRYAVTVGTGRINNPGRYLAAVPPVNGATAASGTDAFDTNTPGNKFQAWDASISFDYMPKQFITYRLEYIHREANVPYFTGSSGITAPSNTASGWNPDLVTTEDRINAALMVRL